MSKKEKTYPKDLPRGRRDLQMLLDRQYTYRESIAWVDAGDGVETFAIPAIAIDPTLRIGGKKPSPNIVWGYIVRYSFLKASEPGESRVKRTRIPRRGFSTEAKAIGFARGKIEDAERVPQVFNDERYVGDPDARIRAERAYLDDLRANDPSFPRWHEARALLPGV